MCRIKLSTLWALICFVVIYFALLFTVLILNEWKVRRVVNNEHVSTFEEYGKLKLELIFDAVT